MRKIGSRLKKFFFPPSDTATILKVVPYAIMGILTFFLLIGANVGWEYTNSSEFCGTSCHTMPPEYSAYLTSPHARVECVECHIGRDVLSTQVFRKAGDLRHVFFTLTQTYEFPIRSHNMRPARDSCETCHFPEKFSDDSLREIKHYSDEEEPTASSTFLIMKTGGGIERVGIGQGIHWHIENQVWYYATDDLDQNIPYVRVLDNENNVIGEYYDVAEGFTPELAAGKELERMDCISCHNRITHEIARPEEAVDQAIDKKIIPIDLPFVRQQAVSVLRMQTENDQQALEQIESFADFYVEHYPEIYSEREDEIQAIVVTLQDIYSSIVFKEQKINWDTHPNNLGHKTDPGCFRCHDGGHLTQSGEAIRLECNLCHSIPVEVQPNALTTNIELVSGPEPHSHTHSSWIALHGQAIDSSCIGCHTPNDPSVILDQLAGLPPADGSFCGNTACHGPDWEYIKFDSPEMANTLSIQLFQLLNTSPYLLPDTPLTYEEGFKTLLDGRCIACHSGPDPEADLDLSTYENVLSVVTPGDPEASLLYQRQTEKLGHFGQMISDEIAALATWISTGAPEK
jgi:nitrate/TMAO reductase-like tetraheme cytochrome c subunit